MRSFALLLLLTMSALAQPDRPAINEDRTRLLIRGKVFLDSQKDGYMHLSEIRYAPDGKRFLVLACGFECTDNVGFTFNADGTGKRKFTARWDWILQDKIEWSADSRYVFYYRTISTGADPPPKAPREGWMQVAVKTGTKASAILRRLKANARYAVFRVSENDPLNLRNSPGLKSRIIGKLSFDRKGIRFLGETRQVGREVWVKITVGERTGWVNQSYLYEEAPS